MLQTDTSDDKCHETAGNNKKFKMNSTHHCEVRQDNFDWSVLPSWYLS